MNNIQDKKSEHLIFESLLQGAIGYWGSHAINVLSASAKEGKFVLYTSVCAITPIQSAICSLTFAIVDRLAYNYFKTIPENNTAKAQLLRMVTTFSISTAACAIYLGVSLQMAGLATLTGIVGMAILLGTATLYNQPTVYIRPLIDPSHKVI